LFLAAASVSRILLSENSGASGSLFDDAYADVVRDGGWRYSSSLLMWVVVAVVWAHEASVWYLLLGMLGAMSVAFALWVPRFQLPHARATIPASSRYVSVWYVPSSLLSLLCVYMLPLTVMPPPGMATSEVFFQNRNKLLFERVLVFVLLCLLVCFA
jgi:hypothetical protein